MLEQAQVRPRPAGGQLTVFVAVLFGILGLVVLVSFVLSFVWRRQALGEARDGELSEEDLDWATGANTTTEIVTTSGPGRASWYRWGRVLKSRVPQDDI
jgi:hypothetical protein